MNDLFALQAPLAEQDGGESGPAHLQPPAAISQLAKHWAVARNEFNHSGQGPLRDITKELLSLGAIRALYWLALGNGEVALAKEIGQWWAHCQPLHGLGETIR